MGPPSSLSVLAVFILFVAFGLVSSHRRLMSRGCEPVVCQTVLGGDSVTLESLADEGRVDCNCTCGADGRTILHESVFSRVLVTVDLRRPLFDFLLDTLRCPIDVVDNDGRTPLHLASAECNFGIADIFATNGASLTVRDNAGDTALCIAAVQTGSRCPVLINMFIRRGADPCALCGDGQLPFEKAIDSSVKNILRRNGGVDC